MYNIALFFFGGTKYWYRKLLLERLEGLISDFDVMFFLNASERFCETFAVWESRVGRVDRPT